MLEQMFTEQQNMLEQDMAFLVSLIMVLDDQDE